METRTTRPDHGQASPRRRRRRSPTCRRPAPPCRSRTRRTRWTLPMNTDSTASTLPRFSSGVTSGTSEPRMNTLTMSAADSTTQRDERDAVVVWSRRARRCRHRTRRRRPATSCRHGAAPAGPRAATPWPPHRTRGRRAAIRRRRRRRPSRSLAMTGINATAPRTARRTGRERSRRATPACGG